MPDTIEIRSLRVSAHVGVPDAERAVSQILLVTVVMTPGQNFDGLADDITRTLDYAVISQEISILAAARPRRLIETLATDLANHLLGNHPIAQVAITIEKHILPNTECVAVHLVRCRA